MKKLLGVVLLIALTVSFFATAAFALSDAQYKKMMAQSAEFRHAEQKLEAMWKHAQAALNAQAFAELKQDQAKWVKGGRDYTAKQYMDDGASMASAYAKATDDRTRYLNGQIMFVETHGGGANSGGGRIPHTVMNPGPVRIPAGSDLEYRVLLTESEELRLNDRKLAEAMQRAKQGMSAPGYRRLEAEQHEWLKTGRYASAKEYMDSGTPRAEAYCEAVFARIRYINNKIDAAPAPSNHLSNVTGTYKREGMSAAEFVVVSWADRANNVLHFELNQRDGNGKIQVSFMNGTLNGDTVVARDTGDDNLSAKIVFTRDGGFSLTPNSAFKRFQEHLRNRPSFEGSYGRG